MRTDDTESITVLDRMKHTVVQRQILCVDDEVVGVRIRGKILESEGYCVVLYHCPFAALRCDLSSISLALLDFEMPGMNGRDLLLRMRALGAPFPIVLLSGSASFLSQEDRVLFSHCLDKGEPIHVLLETVGRFLDPNEVPDFGG